MAFPLQAKKQTKAAKKEGGCSGSIQGNFLSSQKNKRRVIIEEIFYNFGYQIDCVTSELFK